MLETPATRRTRTRRTSTTTAGPSTSVPSPSSWQSQWAFSQSTYTLKKTKRRASEPNTTSSKPPRPLRRTPAYQVIATDEGVHAPVQDHRTHRVSHPRWEWKLVADLEGEVWDWVYQWGIYPFMPSAETLWRVEVGLQGLIALREILGFYKSTTVSRRTWKMEQTGGPRQYEVRTALPFF